MKYRKHFVTNSSSSCFVATYYGKESCLEEVKRKIKENGYSMYPIGKEGKTGFSSAGICSDFDTRLNFVAMILLQEYADADTCDKFKLLNEVFEEEAGIPLDWNHILRLRYVYKIDSEFDNYGYFENEVDHESLMLYSNIFSDKESMKQFLFGKKSVLIQGWDGFSEEQDKAILSYEINGEFSCEDSNSC